MSRGLSVPPRERKWRKTTGEWADMCIRSHKMHREALDSSNLVCALGIDPSLTGTGVAVVLHDTHTDKVVDAVSGTIRTDPKRGDARLQDINRALCSAVGSAAVVREADGRGGLVVASRMPTAIEDLPKHAHGAGITGMAQGITRYWLHQNELGRHYASVPPASLKKFATGKGNATKELMGEAYDRVFAGHDNQGYHVDDNQVDAAFLALWAVKHVAPVVHE